MYYLALVLAWMSGVTCGIAAAMVLREYFLRWPGAVPELDAHERSAWPVERGR